LGIAVNPVEEEAPILLHGPIAAAILSRDYGIDDADVLAVARYHTLARVRQLADRDLDAAILEYLNQHLLEASRRGWPLHPNTVAARNELLLGRAGRGQD